MEQTNNNNDIDDIDDIDDNIRPPDPVIREKLVDYGDDDFTDYNYNYLEPEPNLDQIMKQSLEEFEIAEMQKVQEMLINERNKMTEKYVNIKNKLKKVQMYDATNKDTYETIITIIEMYELNYIDNYMLDETSCNTIFKLLKTIRLTKEELILLEGLFVSN